MFVGCPSIGINRDGSSQAACVQTALETHAGEWNPAALRSRVLTMVGGDGAVAAGGADMRHVSTEPLCAVGHLAGELHELLHVCKPC